MGSLIIGDKVTLPYRLKRSSTMRHGRGQDAWLPKVIAQELCMHLQPSCKKRDCSETDILMGQVMYFATIRVNSIEFGDPLKSVAITVQYFHKALWYDAKNRTGLWTVWSTIKVWFKYILIKQIAQTVWYETSCLATRWNSNIWYRLIHHIVTFGEVNNDYCHMNNMLKRLASNSSISSKPNHFLKFSS